MTGIPLTRRGFLAATSALAAAAALPGGGSAAARAVAGHTFVTRPDLHPPLIDVRTPPQGTASGGIMLTPAPKPTLSGGFTSTRSIQSGPLIVDDAGQPVWFAPSAGGAATDLKVQRYQGTPVLTWWRGEVVFPPGYGRGECVIADEAYRELVTVRAGNGLQADLHDFVLTEQSTALLLAYRDVPRDLTGIGGPADGVVTEGVVQEVDVASGGVLFEWHSLDHVGEGESYQPLPPDPAAPYDYFHVNSVGLDGDRSLLVSARNTHAVYRIDRASGAVTWRLGGKSSDVALDPAAVFAWQHDARTHADGVLMLFDNGPTSGEDTRSRTLALQVDEQRSSATVVSENPHPDAKLSPNQGNAQLLEGGHVFAGWGGDPAFTEFGAQGQVLLHARMDEEISSYRAVRFPWVGRPDDLPVAAGRAAAPGTTVYASWNGATEVVSWRVLAGPSPDAMAPAGRAQRAGFETRVDVPGAHRFVAVEACDDQGEVLGTSEPVAVA